MTTTKTLNEGMREGDLADLVLPLISVDEYVSLIDSSESIVIGFYVHEELAARDLNRFLQKSAVPLLGTDVSPAPDQHGYYMVFIEFLDNHRLADNLAAILHEIKGLVDIQRWQMRVRGTDGLVPFSADNLYSALKKAKRETKKSEVIECLQRSALSNAEFADQLLILEGAGERYCMDFVAFDRLSTLLHDYKLRQEGLRYDVRSIAKLNRIQRMLGETWQAAQMGRYIMLHSEKDTRGILLKL